MPIERLEDRAVPAFVLIDDRVVLSENPPNSQQLVIMNDGSSDHNQLAFRVRDEQIEALINGEFVDTGFRINGQNDAKLIDAYIDASGASMPVSIDLAGLVEQSNVDGVHSFQPSRSSAVNSTIR